MALQVPNIDDRSFEQLVAEAKALIPKYSPEWTDYLPSDPGITILELFAFLVEAAIYQMNRIPEESLVNFAKLLGMPHIPGRALDETLREALLQLQKKSRAISSDDFEQLAFEATAHEIPIRKVAKAKAIMDWIDGEQYINLVIIPCKWRWAAPLPSIKMRERVYEFIKSRSLITSRLRVLAPRYDKVSIEVHCIGDRRISFDRDILEKNISIAITKYLNPLSGGLAGKGWEFGRPVYRSELFNIIEGVEGVDHVYKLLLGDENNQPSEHFNELLLSSVISLPKLKSPVVIVD